MKNDPQGRPFGHARKFGFIQPLVDNAMYEGLARYECVNATFGRELVELVDHGAGKGITATVAHVNGEDGEERTGETTVIKAKYLVGAEGGRSFTRKWMGVDFEGVSPSTRWVVVDVNNDPLGIPNVYLGADPARPYVSIGMPHGIRRFEFMLFDDEPNERVEDNEFVAQLLREHLPEGVELDIIRRRVFTHHGRVASSFRKGNAMIAGDAAQSTWSLNVRAMGKWRSNSERYFSQHGLTPMKKLATYLVEVSDMASTFAWMVLQPCWSAGCRPFLTTSWISKPQSKLILSVQRSWTSKY